MEVIPSQTLYVNNLNEKIKKDVLKKTLYMLFRQYGKVIEIVACKGFSRRGQAFIVFEDTAAATQALRSKQGFNFYDKPMRIDFAKSKSDVIAKQDGTFVAREKRPPQQKQQQVSAARKRKIGDVETDTSSSSTGATGTTASSSFSVTTASTTAAARGVGVGGGASALKVNTVPHNILFAQGLPEHCTQEVLSNLFRQYVGFVEVRMVPGKREIAFIEFGDSVQAGMALQALHGFKLVAAATDSSSTEESSVASYSLLNLTYANK